MEVQLCNVKWTRLLSSSHPRLFIHWLVMVISRETIALVFRPIFLFTDSRWTWVSLCSSRGCHNYWFTGTKPFRRSNHFTLLNRPFYRYGGHIEFTRFKESISLWQTHGRGEIQVDNFVNLGKEKTENVQNDPILICEWAWPETIYLLLLLLLIIILLLIIFWGGGGVG